MEYADDVIPTFAEVLGIDPAKLTPGKRWPMSSRNVEEIEASAAATVIELDHARLVTKKLVGVLSCSPDLAVRLFMDRRAALSTPRGGAMPVTVSFVTIDPSERLSRLHWCLAGHPPDMSAWISDLIAGGARSVRVDAVP